MYKINYNNYGVNIINLLPLNERKLRNNYNNIGKGEIEKKNSSTIN